MTFGRLRGLLLRLVRRRALAVGVGLALVGPAAWFEFAGRDGAWWVDGLSLVAGATGVALIWAGVMGRRADWITTSNRGDR